MARTAVATILCAFLLVAGRAGWGDFEREVEVLRKLVQAERETTYTGIVVTKEQAKGFRRETKQEFWHSPGGRFRLEPREPAGLPNVLIIDDGRNLYHISLDRKEYSKKPSAGSWLLGPLLQRMMDAGAGGRDEPLRRFIQMAGIQIQRDDTRIAGRTTFALVFNTRPGRNQRRHGRGGPPPPGKITKLYIDQEKYVVLGVEICGPDGELISQSRFESIQFPSRLSSQLFVPNIKGMKEIVPEWGPMSRTRAARKLGWRLVRPGYLVGYAPIDGDTVEVVPFRGRGQGDGAPGVPVVIMRFRNPDGYVLSFFQSTLQPLSSDIKDAEGLRAKIRELEREGEWSADKRTRSYTWVWGQGAERRLLRIEAPRAMSQKKVKEIANSVAYWSGGG